MRTGRNLKTGEIIENEKIQIVIINKENEEMMSFITDRLEIVENLLIMNNFSILLYELDKNFDEDETGVDLMSSYDYEDFDHHITLHLNDRIMFTYEDLKGLENVRIEI